MTEKELKQLYHLNLETKLLQEELEELENKLDYHSPLWEIEIKSGGKNDMIAEYIDEINELKSSIQKNLLKIQKERRRIEEFINLIDDSELRLIVRLRYINNLTWTEIGLETGMDRTTAMRKFKKYKNLHTLHTENNI